MGIQGYIGVCKGIKGYTDVWDYMCTGVYRGVQRKRPKMISLQLAITSLVSNKSEWNNGFITFSFNSEHLDT